MMELTKERLEEIKQCNAAFGRLATLDDVVIMADALLAIMDQEPVAWIAKSKATGEIELDDPHEIATNPECWTDAFPVYAAPQLPQPAVVSDVTRKDFEAWARAAGFNEDWYFFTNVHPNHYDDDHINDMWAAWRDCRAAMPQGAEPVQGWISCGEKMPVENDIVLVVDDGYFVCEAQYREGDFFSAARGKGEFFETTCRDVELWMPLPAAPNQEAE